MVQVAPLKGFGIDLAFVLRRGLSILPRRRDIWSIGTVSAGSWERQMRIFTIAIALVFAPTCLMSAQAATASYAMSVGATVVASCSISAYRLLPPSAASVRSFANPCAQTSPGSAIPTPHPLVSWIRDVAPGVSRLTIAF